MFAWKSGRLRPVAALFTPRTIQSAASTVFNLDYDLTRSNMAVFGILGAERTVPRWLVDLLLAGGHGLGPYYIG
jgi:hypothetical protein